MSTGAEDLGRRLLQRTQNNQITHHRARVYDRRWFGVQLYEFDGDTSGKVTDWMPVVQGVYDYGQLVEVLGLGDGTFLVIGSSGHTVLPSVRATTLTDDDVSALNSFELYGGSLEVDDYSWQVGVDVACTAHYTGFIVWESATLSRRVGIYRVGISFDNGSTYEYGPAKRIEIEGGNVRRLDLSATYMRSGHPTSTVRASVQIQQYNLGTAGDLVWANGFLTARTDPD